MSQLGLINPASPGEITQGGMLVCINRTPGVPFPTTTKPNTSALPTGWRQAGVLAALPKITIGRETNAIKTGIYGLTQALLFKSLDGTISCELYGFNPSVLALGLGVDPVVTSTTGVAYTALTVDPTTNNTSITLGTNSFVAGDELQVCATSDIAFSTNVGRVVTPGSTTVVLDRLLREQPTSGTASKVTSIMIPIGGTTPKQFGFAALIDFPDGSVALVNFPIVQSTKPLDVSIGEGQDAVKVPLDLEAIGFLDSTYGVLVGKVITWA